MSLFWWKQWQFNVNQISKAAEEAKKRIILRNKHFSSEIMCTVSDESGIKLSSLCSSHTCKDSELIRTHTITTACGCMVHLFACFFVQLWASPLLFFHVRFVSATSNVAMLAMSLSLSFLLTIVLLREKRKARHTARTLVSATLPLAEHTN